MGGEKEGDGRGFVAAARRSGLYVARRKGKGKAARRAASVEGGAKKSSELRQAALAGQLAQRGSGDCSYSPHLISTRLSGRRMRRTGRSLPRRGSCGGVEAEQAKMTKVAAELSSLGRARTARAPHTQSRDAQARARTGVDISLALATAAPRGRKGPWLKLLLEAAAAVPGPGPGARAHHAR